MYAVSTARLWWLVGAVCVMLQDTVAGFSWINSRKPCKDENRWTCYQPPCQSTRCARWPFAQCRNNNCGKCHAEFWLITYGGYIEVTSECDQPRLAKPKMFAESKKPCKKPSRAVRRVLPAPSRRVRTIFPVCETARCPLFPKAECRTNLCGGYPPMAEFWEDDKDVTSECFMKGKDKCADENPNLCKESKKEKGFDFCIDLVNKVNCLETCGYCTYLERGGKVRPKFANPDKSMAELEGKGIFNIFKCVDKKTNLCKESNKETGIALFCTDLIIYVNCLETCGYCGHREHLSGKLRPKVAYPDKSIGKTEISLSTKPCKGTLWMCSASPCHHTRCQNFPFAECRNNFCDGCTAEFWEDGKEVTSECNEMKKPKPSTLSKKPCKKEKMVMCYMVPCQFKRCPAYPLAECRNNYCGGCFFEFWQDGKEVTSECLMKDIGGNIGPPANKAHDDHKGHDNHKGHGDHKDDAKNTDSVDTVNKNGAVGAEQPRHVSLLLGAIVMWRLVTARHL